MFKETKVATRLALAFGAVLLILVAVVLAGVSRMAVVNDHLHAITSENNIEARGAKEIRGHAYQVSVLARDLIISTDAVEIKTQRALLDSEMTALEHSVDDLDKLFNSLSSTTATEKDLIGKIKDVLPAFRSAAFKVGDLGVANKGAEASVALRGDFEPRNEILHPTAEKLAVFEDK